MTAFDTNVLVRVLLGDDPSQTAVAEAAFVEHAAGVYVPQLVLADLTPAAESARPGASG